MAATALREHLGKDLQATELLEVTLRRADSVSETLNPFVHRLDERAMEAAKESDLRIRTGDARSLEGLPMTVKDTLWVQGVESADGSRARSGFVPPATDVAVRRAEQAGAVIFAKTTNPELCYFGYSRSDLNGETANPWDLQRTAGGSSAGAAAALAAGVGPLALGTDGGGSLRIPAAFCGAATHKPTNGAVPYWPDLSAWPTLSVIGPMARSVTDLLMLFNVIAGHEEADLFSAPETSPKSVRDGLADAVLAFDVDRGGSIPIEPYVRELFGTVIEELRTGGATMVAEAPDRPESGVATWLTVATAEARAAHKREFEEHSQLLGEDARTFLAMGDEVTGQGLARAQRARSEIHVAYARFFEETGADVLLTPALGLAAFASDTLCPAYVDGVPIERPYDDWQGHLWDANLAGLPAAVVPIGLAGPNLPIGMQIVGRRFDDATVLARALAIEDLLGLEMRPPSLTSQAAPRA
ncbi:MAG: amidase [Solirubrobacterales bacterium]